MTIDEKLTRLQQEIDSLDLALGSVSGSKTGSDAQAVKVQIAARFESCEMVLKSLRKDIADKDKDDPIRAAVLSLRDRLSTLLDRYEVEPDAKQGQAAAA
ncbi:MAG: hypothetical protein ABIU20_05000 [Blastocatellia bacterium]